MIRFLEVFSPLRVLFLHLLSQPLRANALLAALTTAVAVMLSTLQAIYHLSPSASSAVLGISAFLLFSTLCIIVLGIEFPRSAICRYLSLKLLEAVQRDAARYSRLRVLLAKLEIREADALSFLRENLPRWCCKKGSPLAGSFRAALNNHAERHECNGG